MEESQRESERTLQEEMRVNQKEEEIRRKLQYQEELQLSKIREEEDEDRKRQI